MAETDGTALRSGRPGARDRSALTAVSLMLMCGRFARFPPRSLPICSARGFRLKPRYNIAPTQALLLARNARGQPRARVPALGLDPALVQGAEDRL
jgi:hypothetical protein